MDLNNVNPEASKDPDMYFRLLSSPSGPRLGRLAVNKVTIDTPSFVAPASRGAVPHLSHDNLRDHTDIKGIYVALEDFVEKYPPNVPIYNQAAGSLRNFTSTPSKSLLILSGRRVPPVTTAASNTDHSLAILTSVGFRMLPIDDYVSAVSRLRPDIVLGLPDIPSNTPGKHRGPKMVFRTDLWLQLLLNKTIATADYTPRIFAPLLPLDFEEQSYYIDTLTDKIDKLSGLALYDSALATELPEELEKLPRMSVDDAESPHKVLQQVRWGIDLFNLGFITTATDAGIALDFEFPRHTAAGEEIRPLGVDLWGKEHATDLGPLGQGCSCYACRKHHKAYVQHLLVAKEMTAWVLLQIHNTKVIDQFFAAVRGSIERGSFEEDVAIFGRFYESEMPERKGQGPRLRGYQFKSQGGTGKKNPKSFTKLGAAGVPAGDMREELDEAVESGVKEAVNGLEGGFVERLS